MVGIGAKIFDRGNDLDTARKLAEGCLWAYESMPSRIMPEIMNVLPCPRSGNCTWDQTKWHEVVSTTNNPYEGSVEEIITEKGLPPGVSSIHDGRYILRPEAIESVFVLYRITGDQSLQDRAWTMFQSIEKHTRTEIAHAALEDVAKQKPVQLNEWSPSGLARR